MSSLADLGPALEELLDKEMAEADVPGVVVGVKHGDDRLVVGRGVTNVENPLEVDGRTLFQIGSTTKTFTATAVMRLVDEGRLGLDDRVVDHLPEFRLANEGDGNLVTIRHLLTHTGGWSGDWFLLSAPDYGREGALAKVVADMWQAPQVVAPGEAYSYNNAGFYVLGRIIEVVTGQAYPEAVRRLVLEPVGLGHSFFYADEMVTHRVSAGHVGADDGPSVFRPWPRPFYAWPAGALCSCADDLLDWAAFWEGDGRGPGGERVLEPSTMTTMTTAEVEIDSSSSLGLCWMIRDVGGVRVVAHGGATNGFLSVFATAPAERFAVTITSNSSAAGALNRRVERWVLEQVLGVTEDDPEPVVSTLGDLAPLAGRYGLGPDAGWAHEIEVDGDDPTTPALVLVGGTPGSPQPPPRFRLVLCGPDEVVCTEPAASAGLRGRFGRRPDGSVAWVRFGGRVYSRLS